MPEDTQQKDHLKFTFGKQNKPDKAADNNNPD